MGAARRIEDGWSRQGIAPVCALQLFGMRRSGNHAVIDWLMRNAPDGATGGAHYNNCRWGADPLQAFANADVFDAAGQWQASVGRLALSGAGARPMIAISYEDRAPLSIDAPQKASRGFAAGDFTHAIVVYRSFLNWSASLMAKLKRNPAYGAAERLRVMMNALPHYAECLSRAAEAGYVGICYDDWVASKPYRAAKLAQLGLPERDNTLGEPQRYGGGSSFDQDEAQTLSRDTVMAGEAEYQMFLWTVAHDLTFMETLASHFEEDAERLVSMAERAEIKVNLPPRKDHR